MAKRNMSEMFMEPCNPVRMEKERVKKEGYANTTRRI